MKLTKLIGILALAVAAACSYELGPRGSDEITGGGGSGSCPPHEIGDGACTNDNDLAIYTELGDGCIPDGIDVVSETARTCATGSPPGCGAELIAALSDPDKVPALKACVVECANGTIEADTGSTLSAECGTCYGDTVTCSAQFCTMPCGQDPSSDACVQCQTDNGCIAAFDECSGLPRT